jgi:hypothetical protein
VILFLIPLGGIVLGLVLWIGLRGLGALSMGGGTGTRSERSTWRERRGDGHGAGFSLPSLRSGGTTAQGVRDWADRIPTGCLIAVIAATGVWILGWLIFLIFGLNFLS